MYCYTTFREWFDNKITEPIECIKITGKSCEIGDDKKWPDFDPNHCYSLADFAPFLDIEFYPGYGAQDCPSINVYTKNYIYTVREYDGSVWLEEIQRHPTILK